MQRNTRMAMGVVFFTLILIILFAVLTIVYSNPIQSLLLLLCFAVVGVAVLARGISRPSSRIAADEHASRSRVSASPNVTPHSMLGAAKRAHPTKVRIRVERWENERRAVVEEPLEKALRRAHSHACPKCGSPAASICACRYRSRFQ